MACAKHTLFKLIIIKFIIQLSGYKGNDFLNRASTSVKKTMLFSETV